MVKDNIKAEPAPENAGHDHIRHKPVWIEHLELRRDELVSCVTRLAAEGQVKRIRVTEPDGDILIEMPLTIGAIAGGAVILAAPLLALLSALAAYVAEVNIDVVRGTEPSRRH
jgi:hypothetical protein